MSVESVDDLLTVRQVAEIAKVPYTVASRWLAVGAYGRVLPYTRYGEKVQLVRRSDLDPFLEHYHAHKDKRSHRMTG